jgi:hypothetical protein
MALYENNLFVGQRIQVDGHQFIHNTFQNCVLVYGGGPFVLRDNVLHNVQWQFIDAAARTVYLLSSFHQSGGPAREFLELLLSTFGKPVQTAPPPTPGEAGPLVTTSQVPVNPTSQEEPRV